MIEHGAGKGDKYRTVNKKIYDKNWIIAFGKKCKNCKGTGEVRVVEENFSSIANCPFCDGLGKVEK